MNSCLLCSGKILRHIECDGTQYWQCTHCRQQLSDSLMQRYRREIPQVTLPKRHCRAKRHNFKATLCQSSRLRFARPAQIVCQYHNTTSAPQVVRIVNVSDTHWEHTVLPQQKVVFTTVWEAELEVIAGPSVTTMMTEKVACQTLCIEKIWRRATPTPPFSDCGSGQSLANDRDAAAKSPLLSV